MNIDGISSLNLPVHMYAEAASGSMSRDQSGETLEKQSTLMVRRRYKKSPMKHLSSQRLMKEQRRKEEEVVNFFLHHIPADKRNA